MVFELFSSAVAAFVRILQVQSKFSARINGDRIPFVVLKPPPRDRLDAGVDGGMMPSAVAHGTWESCASMVSHVAAASPDSEIRPRRRRVPEGCSAVRTPAHEVTVLAVASAAS